MKATVALAIATTAQGSVSTGDVARFEKIMTALARYKNNLKKHKAEPGQETRRPGPDGP